MTDKLAIVDIETTGDSSTSDGIIEIGIVFVENGKATHNFQTLVNPQKRLSPYIEDYTGIKTADLENAPTFYEIKDQLFDMLYDRVFVAHNARFDYSFIKNHFKFYDINFSTKQLCTVKLSRYLFPHFRHHNLDSIISRYGIRCERRHRALDDAKATWDFLEAVFKETPNDILDPILKKLLKTASVPINIHHSMLEDLPENPGVYIFYGENAIPLYIGKSVNIKDRVLSHFSNDTQSSRELKISQQLKDIKTIETAGELGALILESKLIKELKPIYNRALRESRTLTVIKKGVDENGYYITEIDTADNIEPQDYENILGVFKNVKSAKTQLIQLAHQFELCDKLLGLQKISGPCFGYHLKTCKGACINEEKVISYNLRFIQAFEKTKIKTWPFESFIVINEKSEKIFEAFVFNNWCLIGKLDDYSNLITENATSNFDYDLYKILNRYLKKPNAYKFMKTLSLNTKDFTNDGY